jgi:hypothetical protein
VTSNVRAVLALCDELRLLAPHDARYPSVLAHLDHDWRALSVAEQAEVDQILEQRRGLPSRSQQRDKKLLALLDAARDLADVAGAGPQFRSNALDALVTAALAWTVEECPICGRRGDHEWEELTDTERVAHEAVAASQGI